MLSVQGVILVDASEVIVRLYQKGHIKLIEIASFTYDCTNFSRRKDQSTDLIVATLRKILKQCSMVDKWQIFGRQVMPETLEKIEIALSTPIEELTYHHEQKLLMDGYVANTQGYVV